jgi:hypothetical protein
MDNAKLDVNDSSQMVLFFENLEVVEEIYNATPHRHIMGSCKFLFLLLRRSL